MDKDEPNFNIENESEENFEELLNQTVVGPVQLNPGEQVEAEVTSITKNGVFIDLGGKSEGYIAIDEFVDDEEKITIKEGDKVKAFFLSSKNNEMLFTTRLTGGKGGQEHLQDAYRNRIPVEGLVEKEIKGGFDVKIAGNVRAFCPYSQMGAKRVNDSGQYVGQNLIFKIIEYDEKGRNIIISHRAVLEEECEKQKQALQESLKEGMTVSGEITSIKKFGAFVDVGGIQGLIPISEISWGRVEDINHLLSVGQRVDVLIKKLDWENDKFSFSLKEILPDPWNDIGLKYPEGSVHKGRVARLAPFGAFVTLEPGIDGLIHISELVKDKRINHPREVLEENQDIEVKIARVSEEEKRLSLRMISDVQDEDEGDFSKRYMTTDSNKSSGSFGTLGDILRAKMDKKKGSD